jgi:hypothetical protein
VELAFREWVKLQEPINENWIENLDKLVRMSPQLAKYLPLAVKEIDKDPDLRSVIQNRSALLALHHALKRVTEPDFMQSLNRAADVGVQTQVQDLQLKDFAKTEIAIREKLIPVWRIIIRVLDLFHITPLVTKAVPKFKEFADCFARLTMAKEKQEFKVLAKCAASAFLQFLHQVTSTTLFSGLAAKIVAILGMLGLAAQMTGVVFIVWILLIILSYVKGKIDPTKTMAWVIGMIIHIFSPGHGAEKEKRPPIFVTKPQQERKPEPKAPVWAGPAMHNVANLMNPGMFL